ncbi:MAG: bifunctional UDP-N-acetylglucosamine diphosphorylase/glucosamine-1-phosphate N-acetyltransferase GlmU [Clostridia bacterium]|nr:bifunctional UDP-N-acetylglucosamine diphosphorylase/glucosamine-1-phosphate N-acetyltransferase GlmU [Clostridia bacterium]
MARNCAVILAGGEGTRMHSQKPKVMAEILFRPMIDRVLGAVNKAGIYDICVVTGYKAEILEAHLEGKAATVRQTQRLGTGHAVMQAADYIREGGFENVLILNGDAPFIDAFTITDALKYHTNNRFVQTVISAKIDDPYGYGRIIRNKSYNFVAIVEEASADAETKRINEINSGAMWFQADALLRLLGQIRNDNSKGEYYLTDTVSIAVKENLPVGAFTAENANAVLGANTRVQLHELNELLRMKTIRRHMEAGVSIPCTDGVMIDDDAEIGADTVILPGTILKADCRIGENCVIGPNTVLYKTTVGSNCVLNQVQAEEAEVRNGANLGPFVHLRPNTVIGEGVHCGNFVEVKNSVVGDHTSVSHLTYVGDADVGKGVNFGCGVVTVNFNGKTKNRCVIGDDAFIGCNTNLIAPVKVGERAYTAAGSTITEDVPADALAIARQRQQNKERWVVRKKPYRPKKY